MLAATGCPIARSAAANLAWLLETQRKGRTGSPSVTGSTAGIGSSQKSEILRTRHSALVFPPKGQKMIKMLMA